MPDTGMGRIAPDYRTSPSPAYQAVIANDPKPAPALFREYAETDVDCAVVPRAHYTSPEFAKLEMEKMWPKVWQMACRAEQIPEPGDVLVYNSPGASLLIVHTETGAIKAYYNSCLHRGMQLCAENTSVNKLACPFHGFTWNLDGSLAHIPARWDFPHIEEKTFNLPEAKVGSWGGFIFINRDLNAKPLEEYLGHLIPHFVDWPRDQVYLAAQIRKTIHANYKICIEGFVESYHLSGIHAQALPFGGDSSTQYDVWPDDDNVSRFLEPTGVQSDQYPVQLTEQQILDASLEIVFGKGPTPQLPEGAQARTFLAEAMRTSASAQDGVDYSHLSDTEATDAMQYSLFPNFILFRSLPYPFAYRFLPARNDPNYATYDFLIFKPKPTDGSPIPETQYINLGDNDTFAGSGALPPWLGEIYDQDSTGLAMCQDGLRDGGTADVTYSRYQESRIRHLHATLAKYLNA